MTIASALWILIFMTGVPLVAMVLWTMPKTKRLGLGLLVFTTCYIKKPFYQEVFFINYRGVDRGYMVALPDLLFFGFLLVILGGRYGGKIVWKPFNTLPWLALLGVSAVSTGLSDSPLLGSFTLHKFVRCYILYWVIVNLVRDRRDVWAVIWGATAAVLIEGYFVLWDKYVTGAVVNRSVGTFRHPNTLAMYCNLAGPVLLAVALTSVAKGWRGLVLLGAVVAGMVSVIFTKSRAGIVLHPSALGLASLLSFLFRPTGRKMGLLAVGVVVAATIGAAALPRIIARFENAPEESAETRHYFNDAAQAMARDRLFGIGLNLYSHALSREPYYWYVYPDMVDVADPEAFRESVRGQSRLGTVHNIYWLYAAEGGYISLILFLIHIGRFYLRNVVTLLFRARDELHKAVLIGCLAGTTVHHLQGLLEWIFRQTEVMYLYFVLMGLMVAMGASERANLLDDAPKDLSDRKDTSHGT